MMSDPEINIIVEGTTAEQRRSCQPGVSDSLQHSCVSVKTCNSMEKGEYFHKSSHLSEHRRLTSQERSCVSVKTCNSMEKGEYFHKDNPLCKPRIQQQTNTSHEHNCISLMSCQSMEGGNEHFHKGNPPSKPSTLRRRQTSTEHRCVPACLPTENTELLHNGVCDSPHRRAEHEILKNHKLKMKMTSQCVFEETAKHGNPTLLNDIYTELHIMEGESGEVTRNHEVRLIEKISSRPMTKDRAIECNKIFKNLDESLQKDIKTVMTKGVAGIGKTVSVQKFLLDWAEGKANQDITLMLPLPFRELNLMLEKKLSLMSLLEHFFHDLKDLRPLTLENAKVLFIFDGLDECRIHLNFRRKEFCDVTKETAVVNLLTNLITGKLLPSALVWITSRPAASCLIPSKFIDRVTEVRGFNDPQKEEYFRKKIADQFLSSRIISHIKSCRSLFIMCHIPVFCWLSATVLESTLGQGKKTPNTLTQMYTHFLIIQNTIKNKKYLEAKEKDQDMILKLGEVAWKQLDKGNQIFYEGDLKKCGINVTEASVYSGLFTQIFKEEFGLTQKKVFSFVHLSIQEHLAAVYVFFSFCNKDQLSDKPSELQSLLGAASLHKFHKAAVEMALKSKNGHLDLFLRFLLGLSLESNQALLQKLLPQSRCRLQTNEETVQYIKEQIREDHSSDRRINLLYCLVELNHHSVVEKLEKDSGTLSTIMLIPEKWSTLTFKFQISEDELNAFDLKKYLHRPTNHFKEFLSPDEVLQQLLPAVKNATSSDMQGCCITQIGCEALAQAFSANLLNIRHLNLRENRLKDAGMKLLCAGLKSSHCKVEILELRYCELGVESGAALASALRSNSNLKELNLRDNKHMTDVGITQLSTGLKSERCKLERLLLSGCMLSEKSCRDLASCLSSEFSSLTELELSCNRILDSGVEFLSDGMQNLRCKLEKLFICRCKLSGKSCVLLASALHANPSSIRELHLNGNNLHNSEVNMLFALKRNAQYKLDKLIW